MKEIKTWHERAMAHPDHRSGMVSEDMIRARMCEEIADLRAEIERMRDHIRRLREALKPFAVEAEAYDPPEDDDAETAWLSRFTYGNLRDARKALGAKP